MNTLFILGNGFDLDLGFDTRFSDYIKSVHFQGNNNDILGLKHNSLRNELIELAKHLESKAKTDLWFDLENEIITYYKNLAGPADLNIYSQSEIERLNDRLKTHKEIVIPKIKESIVDFIKTEVNAKYYNYKIPKNDNSRSAWLLKKMLVEIMGKNTSQIITFNYTGNEVLKNELKRLIPIDSIKRIDDNKITQIHGNLNSKSNVVIGGTDTEINNESIATFLDKTRQEGIETGNWSSQFFNSFKTFVIFGHSFGETDSYFFKPLIQHLVDNNSVERKNVYIYTSEHGRETITSKITTKYARYAVLTASTKILYNDEEYLNENDISRSYIKAFQPQEPIVEQFKGPQPPTY